MLVLLGLIKRHFPGVVGLNAETSFAVGSPLGAWGGGRNAFASGAKTQLSSCSTVTYLSLLDEGTADDKHMCTLSCNHSTYKVQKMAMDGWHATCVTRQIGANLVSLMFQILRNIN